MVTANPSHYSNRIIYHAANTLFQLEESVKDGVGAEIDLTSALGGNPVLSHDPKLGDTFKHLSEASEQIAELTPDELEKAEPSDAFLNKLRRIHSQVDLNNQGDSLRILSFEKAMAGLEKARKEVKPPIGDNSSDRTPLQTELKTQFLKTKVSEFIHQLFDSNLEDQVTVVSFDMFKLNEARAAAKEWNKLKGYEKNDPNYKKLKIGFNIPPQELEKTIRNLYAKGVEKFFIGRLSTIQPNLHDYLKDQAELTKIVLKENNRREEKAAKTGKPKAPLEIVVWNYKTPLEEEVAQFPSLFDKGITVITDQVKEAKKALDDHNARLKAGQSPQEARQEPRK